MRCGLARDVWTSLPEALHQVTIVMSDRGIPYSYRHMHGFGSHTFSMVNANRERYWVKFHLRTQQGIRNLTDQEAEAIIGKDRESQLTTRGWVKIESRLTGAGSPSRGGVGQGFSEIGAIPRPPCIVLHLG